eukprot:2480537-Alexandrium_andersonii.AAC.1
MITALAHPWGPRRHPWEAPWHPWRAPRHQRRVFHENPPLVRTPPWGGFGAWRQELGCWGAGR